MLFTASGSEKKARIAIFISDKIQFKTKTVIETKKDITL